MKHPEPLSLLLCLSSLISSISCAQQPRGAYTATLYQVPVQPRSTPSVSSPSPVELAVLSYDPADPSLSRILSFNPPSAPPGVDASSLTPDNTTATDPLWNHKTQILTYLRPPSTSSATESKDAPYRTSVTSTLSLLPAFFPHGRFRLLISDPSSSSSRGRKQSPTVLGASFHARLPPPQPRLSPVQAKRQAREQKEREAEQERERVKAARKAKRAAQKAGEKPASAGGAGDPLTSAQAPSLKKPDSKGSFDLLVQSEAKGPVFDRPPRRLLTAAGAGAGGEGAGGAGLGASEGVEGEEGEEGEKSFLQKYWWVLAAVAVLAVTSGGGEG